MLNIDRSQDVAASPAQAKMHIDSKKYFMKVEGHRGAGFLEPENSIKAFKKAVELGLDSVEFDVWLTKDDIPVVVHGLAGGIIEFQNDIKEVIGDIDSKDLLLSKYTLLNGETIPTLEEVLDTCKDKVCLNLEIKEVKELVIEKVLDLLEARNMFEQITFSAFHHYLRETLTREITRRGINIPVTFGFLMRALIPKMPNYEVECQPGDSLNLDIRYLEENREDCLAHIAQAKQRQMHVSFWFPMEYHHEETFWDDLHSIGVTTIITNKPIELIEYFVQKELGV